jgi:hypothetical protein
VNWHQSQTRSQSYLCQHLERLALVVQQRLGDAQQNTDYAVLAAVSADRAVITVDDDTAPVVPWRLGLHHLGLLSSFDSFEHLFESSVR